MREIIAAGLAQWGLDAVKAKTLTGYGELLLVKNQVMNLTAITQPDQVARLHMLDCAALCAHWELRGKTLIDVGTGAGFPGLVIAILCPECQVTLLDPLEKRLGFIQEVVDVLGLSNVSLLHARGEDAGRDAALREGFDFAVSRAVADLAVLGELCLPLVKVGGQFLSMKAVDSEGELAAAQGLLGRLGGQVQAPWDYTIPGTEVTHRVWPIYKRSPTPDQFPRRWAKIKKETGK